MANDRVMIKCKACGGWKMLLKHFPVQGPKTRDNGILEWLDAHAACHPRAFAADLDGNPGFDLHTEDAIGEALAPDKQNYAPGR